MGDFISNLYDENGNYSYDYSYDFIADYLHATEGLGPAAYTPLYYSYGQGFGTPDAEINTREYAGYATDDWRITPRLTLTLGVRYEYEYVPPSPSPNTGNPALVEAFSGIGVAPAPTLGNTAVTATLDKPDDRNNVQPRVGFAYNLYGDGNTILRGGYGLYYGRIINSNIVQTYLESGGVNAQTNFSSLYAGSCGPTFPNLAMSALNIYNCYANNGRAVGLSPVTTPRVPTSTIAYLDPRLRNPEVHEVDMAIEQNLGHGNVLSVTYMGSFGRELTTSIDSNAPLSTSVNTVYTVVDVPVPPLTGYVVHPHGGLKPPLPTGFQVPVKVYTGTGVRPNPFYGQVLDIGSRANSSYNAVAFQFNHRYSNGFSLLSNYTWSHALDYNPYIGTGVPTYNTYDPNDLRDDYGNSSTNVPNRFVAAVTYQPQTHFQGLKEVTLGGWRIAPIVQAQNGLPFSPSVTGSPTLAGVTLAYKSYNGTGSSADRIEQLGRDQVQRPPTIDTDLRLGKNFYFNAYARFRLEFFAEVFNLLNHQNITGETTSAYSLGNTSYNGTLTNTLTSNPNYGVYTNSNSNTVYSQRQLQLAVRLHF